MLHRQQQSLSPRAKSVDFSLTVCIFKHYLETSVWVFEDNWCTEEMYSPCFTRPTHLHAWCNEFCPHPDTGALSQGIGCPHSASLVNWSGSDSSLVYPHCKPQMRRSTKAFIFIRGTQDKVPESYCAAEVVARKALKPEDFSTVLEALKVNSLPHNICAVLLTHLKCRPSSLTYLITWCISAALVVLTRNIYQRRYQWMFLYMVSHWLVL